MCFPKTKRMLSLRDHEKGLEGLIDLNLPAIISTRPVWNGKRLANEAFVLENGAVRPLHRKQYFPNEPGWFESKWYSGDRSGFEVAEILGIKVGVLVCTEAMFNERARAYGRQGASLIVIPRASGRAHRVLENRGCDGVDRVGRLRCEFEPDWLFQKRYAVWRKRLRLCTARKFARGDHASESDADVRTGSDKSNVRAARVSVLRTRTWLRDF